MTDHDLPTTCPDPRCRMPMIRRINRATGEPFYGCPRWPNCTETLPISEREKLIEAGAEPLPGFDL